jgi:hypothetical protein
VWMAMLKVLVHQTRARPSAEPWTLVALLCLIMTSCVHVTCCMPGNMRLSSVPMVSEFHCVRISLENVTKIRITVPFKPILLQLEEVAWSYDE